jgi:hypothetical protein
MYADYPISRELLHWESPSNTAQASNTGQNLIHHQERGYTILVVARATRKRNGLPVPFTAHGPPVCAQDCLRIEAESLGIPFTAI